MEAVVSVIVPVYNGSQYIDRIIDNVLRQTYRHLEVLFIDDGSTDGSADIIRDKIGSLDEVALSSINFRVISQPNMGQGGARNTGIDNASGDYLLFMDQDDYIESEYIDMLVKHAVYTDADMIFSGYKHVDSNGNVLDQAVLTNDDWCRFMNITPWGKIYKCSYIRDNNIRFLPVPLGEDIYFNVRAYSHTDKAVHSDYVGYSWLLNESSVSNTTHRRYDEKANMVTLFKTMSKMDGAEKWMADKTFEFFILKTALFHILYLAGYESNKKLLSYRDDVFRWIKKYFPDYKYNKLIGWNKPDGERANVRHVIAMYMLMHRVGVDKAFLVVLNTGMKVLSRVRGMGK